MKFIKYFLYRLKWHLAKYIDFKYPVHLDLELNNNCNQKCIACWHSERELPFKINIMSLSQAKKFLDEGKELKIKSVKFNLRGEPLLHPYLYEIIKYAKKIGYIETMINTNGIFLDQQLINSLNKYLDTMIISIDSFEIDEYCEIHNCTKRDFRKLMENLKILSKMWIKNKLKMKVKLNYHLNLYNKNLSLERYYTNFSMFKLIKNYTRKRYGKDIVIDDIYKKRLKKCPHMQRRITVLADGKIYPCCMCYTENIYLQLGEKGLVNAWNSLKRLLLKQNYIRRQYLKICENCTSNEIYK